MKSARIELPIPPSANRLYRNGARGIGRFDTQDYKDWKAAAGWAILQQKVSPFLNPVRVVVTVTGGSDFNGLRDIDNCLKASLDLLKNQGIIPNDSVKWVKKVSASYEERLNKTDCARCIVEITEIEGE
jgi:Holliday junction resolvase RusA-like endonuclease